MNAALTAARRAAGTMAVRGAGLSVVVALAARCAVRRGGCGAGPRAAPAPRAAPDPPGPHRAERAWVEACVLTAQAHPPRAAFGRCAWRIVADVPGRTGRGPAVARLPPLPDRPQAARACARWSRRRSGSSSSIAGSASWGCSRSGAAQEALRRAQRAFPGYRDVACPAEGRSRRPRTRGSAPPVLPAGTDGVAGAGAEAPAGRDLLAIAAASAEGP